MGLVSNSEWGFFVQIYTIKHQQHSHEDRNYVFLSLALTCSLSSLPGGLPYEFKVVIAGNHELTFDKDFMAELVKQDYYRFPSVSKLKPEDFDNVQSLLTNCVYLQDSDVTIKGFRIYGTPW